MSESKTMKKGEPFWCWPESAQSPGDGVDVRGVQSPYGQNGEKIAMCYPGTPLRPEVKELIHELADRQLNAIGTHTHGSMKDGAWTSPDGEGGFPGLAEAERTAIWMIASQLGGRFDTVDGYFCGGGTDANMMGIWIGRQWLRNRPDPMNRGIVVLTTPIAHYSIMKATDITDIGRSQTTLCPKCRRPHLMHGDRSGSGMAYVGMDETGGMDVADLERVFRLKYEEGFRRFIVVPAIGTTVLGSVDPIWEIDQTIQRLQGTSNAHFYVHVDASFGGFTAPFTGTPKPFGFQNSSVMSITVDADKMGHLAYPAGVFLCRKGLQELVARKVAYIRGTHDDTLPGSRSALAPLIAYDLYRKIGVDGHRAYVQGCMEVRDYLEGRLRAIGDDRLVIGPVPEWTNFLPIEVRIENGAIPARLREGKGALLEPYHLRSDYVPSATDVRSCPRIVYKLCIMPHHTREAVDQFVADLTTVLATE
jgi:tyrosine decarboxylase/aspartate 1-decarboxylase